ncbi:MAG: thioredoxin family protein, partial [Gammaproteobacteria bacterium]|nr:thioredoxin family protein [Gammaproteobacteria bacterium]
MHKSVSMLLAAFMLMSCGAEQTETPTPAPVVQQQPAPELDPVDGIDWFDGTVDEAFAAAKEAGKPIFLYWGAVWCPPCHAISATVFKSPEFIERSQLFVPVYLDGDKEHAQAYGEKFGVRGYPTMIVFDADGVELTRIPGGIDMQAYANILDLTLSNSSSASELVTSVMAGDTDLTPADCTLLAYNSWGQDTTILADYDEGQAFLRMRDACPSDMRIERSILFFSWLGKALKAEDDEGNPVPLSDEQRAETRQQFEALLADSELVRANIFTVLFSGDEIIAAVMPGDAPERDDLIARHHAVLNELAGDESVYKRERIYTLAGKIGLERIDDPEAELSAALQQEIRDMTVWADESTPSVYERQPIINALANVLDEAGMDDVAKPLLLAELERSGQPYYFMPGIADIEQRAGNEEAAIEWLQKGYDSTRGPATRFQWGYYYLTGLLEMAPADVERIHATTIGLLAELQQSD